MDKFKNKYRITSHRKPGWDYAADGLYFITLVTQNRICNLGEIADSKINLSDFGEIVNREWLKSFEIRQELFCDEYIIMPNHLHAILIIEQPTTVDGPVETHGRASLRDGGRASLRRKQRPTDENHGDNKNHSSFIRKPKSISSFVAGFKSAINTKIDDYIDAHQLNIPKYNRNNRFFQPNYHDRIIRNENEYLRIKNYIINNPLNWNNDTFNENSE